MRSMIFKDRCLFYNLNDKRCDRMNMLGKPPVIAAVAEMTQTGLVSHNLLQATLANINSEPASGVPAWDKKGPYIRCQGTDQKGVPIPAQQVLCRAGYVSVHETPQESTKIILTNPQEVINELIRRGICHR